MGTRLISNIMAPILPRSFFNKAFAVNQIRRCSKKQVTSSLIAEEQGEYKTRLASIDDEFNNDMFLIKSFSNKGFRLTNDIFVFGAIAVFPRQIFQWDITGSTGINEESLSLFTLLEPPIDLLIIGKIFLFFYYKFKEIF